MKFRIELPVQFRDIDRMGPCQPCGLLAVHGDCACRACETSRHDKRRVQFQLHSRHGPCRVQKPIRDEPRVTVSCWVSRIGERPWDLDYIVKAGRVEIATGRTTQVGYNYDTRATVRISEKLRKAQGKHTGKRLRFREVC